ncbi:hypothetical protein [Streptomyces thermodiastaticus]|uniref:hypothetical protein n=1 Tax=Streptomyces thermodiastaticus TaxID=44061 RepID=UPI001673815B|nr:hypothetical protein [Streptomyces thermodiastaticus]MCE7552773.1 hypothetical protein [Streptomyces thermodiastaticus]GHF89007.1 hypothetical protein GCM10018787_42110 [Streptomyces thermodiastaticus]
MLPNQTSTTAATTRPLLAPSRPGDLVYGDVTPAYLSLLGPGAVVSAVRFLADGRTLRLTFVREYGAELWSVPGLNARGLTDEELSRDLACVVYAPEYSSADWRRSLRDKETPE